MAVTFKQLEFNPEIYDVFRDHGQSRFGQAARSRTNSRGTSTSPPARGWQSEYRLDGALVAAGFLDRSERALSSVCFAFRPSAAV